MTDDFIRGYAAALANISRLKNDPRIVCAALDYAGLDYLAISWPSVGADARDLAEIERCLRDAGSDPQIAEVERIRGPRRRRK